MRIGTARQRAVAAVLWDVILRQALLFSCLTVHKTRRDVRAATGGVCGEHRCHGILTSDV